MSNSLFAARGDHDAIENGTALMPRFDADGLIVAIATDATDGEVLMVAYMDAEALARTIETGEAWFYSRSRRRLWKKGEESGNVLAVSDIRIDCDQDAVVLKVTLGGDGVACHQGYRSCFYRSVPIGTAPDAELSLEPDTAMKRVKRAER
ncbi:phosphoribosyl-AMP cyclohydrolase [Bauldia sp.]|uniref:phosphoribosyl-AMP cyclohydrolase n=1 Tax=Bauldia sp. TaxID=2575872 RepID=UPI003BA979FD